MTLSLAPSRPPGRPAKGAGAAAPVAHPALEEIANKNCPSCQHTLHGGTNFPLCDFHAALTEDTQAPRREKPSGRPPKRGKKRRCYPPAESRAHCYRTTTWRNAPPGATESATCCCQFVCQGPANSHLLRCHRVVRTQSSYRSVQLVHDVPDLAVEVEQKMTNVTLAVPAFRELLRRPPSK